jgi:hypothetical protein
MEPSSCAAWPETVKVDVPATGPEDVFIVAVIVVSPVLTAVATPVELMVATPALLEAHVTWLVMSWVLEG